MKKIITLILLLVVAGFVTTATAINPKNLHYIPLSSWQLQSLGSQQLSSPAVGLIIQEDDLQIIGFYQTHKFNKALDFDFPQEYHSLSFMLEKKVNRHQYISFFSSDSDQPVSGGLHTFQAASVWGYSLLTGQKLELILGGGIGISDFGIELANGDPLPIIPLPLIRAKYRSSLLAAACDFITGPSFELLFAPERQIRLKSELRIDNLRDLRDLIFDLSLHYRFFAKDHALGDFAGISVGLKNDNLSFDLAEKNDVYDLHYYALYGEIDFTLLKVTAGHSFKNREMYREQDKFELEDGFFFAIQALYQF
jgi:hypothetical protein